VTLVEPGRADSASVGDRKQLGSWYTPPELVEHVVAGVLDESALAELPRHRPVRVVDPACGDGRFLAAAAERLAGSGREVELVGVDIDPAACAAATELVPGGRVVCADALRGDWREPVDRFDLVIGNPPFLSQMASSTTRGGSSEWGGGPYADSAVEFLGLAADLVQPEGGRVAFVLPQSILAARDATPIRDLYDERADMYWSWWSPERSFDAQVHACALAFRFGVRPPRHLCASPFRWTDVVTSRSGVPPAPDLEAGADGSLGDRAWLNANFRDEYYGLVPAVGDHRDGPPLITSGLIDPGRSLWGERSVRFAKQTFAAPRVDLDRLDGKMPRWARKRLVPKVLVANQTPIVEAVCDPAGEWLPGVPVVSAYPHDHGKVWLIAALLTSPAVSAWAWNHQAGTGLSATAIRLSPVLLGGLPWPADERLLGVAARALRAGDRMACGDAVHRSFGITDTVDLTDWWSRALDRIDGRSVRDR
jgi:SAM-dependent methyltransferase